MPALPDLSPLLQLALTALAVLAGAAVLLRAAASRYFFVDAPFAPGDPYRAAVMSIGDPAAPGVCAVCGAAASKKCGRCKGVRYCSSACQSKHWAAHKLKCKQEALPVKPDISSSNSGAYGRRKFSGFSSISLVPARGTCKVLQQPKKILFPYEEFVKLFNWDKPGFLPCGLLNCGNSCFANVILQCLASTRPLVAYLLERDHSRGCIRKRDDWCFLCELQVHIQRACESSHPFSPINILSRLPNIGGNLGNGRQEDAHEFMRFAIDTMQSVCLDEFGGEKALDFSTQETTLIQYIFGGYLQSQVICTKCNMISNRYENMMDLTVEIQGDVDSLEECLDQFTIKEWLDGENMYKCEGCNDYVKAWKRLTVHQAPNILTIALKRFQSGRFGKLNKRVSFPENLDLSPYMSGNGDGTDLYSLYAVVVHVDMLNASFFGHYICYTKDYHGHWYRIDDCKVMHVEVEEVLAQGAYMLLYSRRTARSEPFIKPMEPANKKHISEVAPEPRNIVDADCLSSTDGLQSNVPPSDGPSEVYLHRDIGHERNLLVKSNIIKERKSENMDLDISTEIEPMLMSEDITYVERAQSNSICPTENSSVEVEAMDCEELRLSSNTDNCMEQNTTSNSVTGEVKPTKCTPEDTVSGGNIIPSGADTSTAMVTASSEPEPGISSDGDCYVEQSPIQNLTAEEAFKSLTYTPDLLSRENNVPNMTEISSSASITTTSTMLEPFEDPSPNLEQFAVACGPLSYADRVNRRDDVSCGNKGNQNLISCWVKDSGGKSEPLFSHELLGVRKESAGDGEGISDASKVNGYINRHVKIDFAEPSLCHNDASLESLSVNRKNILSDPALSFISSSSQNRSCNQVVDTAKNANTQFGGTVHPCKTNCDGSAEFDSSQKNVSSDNLSAQFLSTNDKIGKIELACTGRACCEGSSEPDFTEKTNSGSSPELFPSNDKDVLAESSLSFMVPDFLNKFYNKSVSEDGITKKKMDRRYKANFNGSVGVQATGQRLCDNDDGRANCDESSRPDFTTQTLTDNESSLFSSNCNGNLPESGLSFMAPDFLNKLYKKSINKDGVTQNKTDNHCITKHNGYAGLQASDLRFRDNDAGQAFCDGSSEPDFTEQTLTDNESSLELFSSNGEDSHPESGFSFMAPDFLNKYYNKSTNEDGIGKRKSDHRCKTKSNGHAGLQASEQRIRDNEAGMELHSGNGKSTRSGSPSFSLSRGFLSKSYKNPIKVDRMAKKELESTHHPYKTKGNGLAERASVCQDVNIGYIPDSNLVEYNDKRPEEFAFTNGNIVLPLDKNASDLSSLGSDNDVVSANQSEPMSGTCLSGRQQV